MPTIDSIQVIKLPHHFEDNGDLVVMEGLVHVPFAIARVFVVRASKGSIRGQHAHRACTQFLTCPSGAVEVLCDDGTHTKTYSLNHPNLGLLIPPGIWAQQTYQSDDSVLTVLCDHGYEAHDYIREYVAFKNFKQTNLT
jgi:dTDP-4-dehydrorhamnose 3,5-epimerase-like enzyme